MDGDRSPWQQSDEDRNDPSRTPSLLAAAYVYGPGLVLLVVIAWDASIAWDAYRSIDSPSRHPLHRTSQANASP
ncbi:MAG: hypothetical protein Q9214_001409 [Letrouitia sp. 1 TL-2023]